MWLGFSISLLRTSSSDTVCILSWLLAYVFCVGLHFCQNFGAISSNLYKLRLRKSEQGHRSGIFLQHCHAPPRGPRCSAHLKLNKSWSCQISWNGAHGRVICHQMIRNQTSVNRRPWQKHLVSIMLSLIREQSYTVIGAAAISDEASRIIDWIRRIVTSHVRRDCGLLHTCRRRVPAKCYDCLVTLV